MRRRKISLILLTALLLVPTTVRADTTQTITGSSNVTSNPTTVTCSVDSTYSVTVPKEVSLGINGNSTYSVQVEGDIKSNTKIKVEPQDAVPTESGINFILSEALGNKNDIVVTVAQDKQEFTWDEIISGISAPGSISCANLSAGTWTGVLKFDIAAESQASLAPGLYSLDDVLITPWDDLVSAGTVTVTGGTLTTSTNRSALITQKLVIDNTVTDIGTAAFAGCSNLKQVVIPSSVNSIAQNGFRSSGLTSIELPSSVTSIGISAFEQCTSLKSVDSIGDVPEAAFRNCTALESVNLDGTASVGNYAFYGCSKLSNVDLPITLTSIGTYSFRETGVTSVTFPETMTAIADSSFYGCKSLTSVSIPQTITTIGQDAFYNCTALTNAIIPESVTSVGSSAFSSVPHIEYHGLKVPSAAYGAKAVSLVVPDGATSITSGMYSACSYITDVTLPDSVTTIGDMAFQNDTGLKSINIPNSVTSIGYNAFCNCTSLSEMTVPDTVTTVGSDAFYNVPHVTYTGSASGSPWGAVSIN